MDDIHELFRLCAASTDDELFLRLERRTIGERAHLVEILVILGELDARRAALGRAFSSLFVYCTRILGYCERTAYRRIAVARAGRKFPLIFDRLRAGKLHLSAAVMLADHLSPENAVTLLARADGATLEELKRLKAVLSPESAAPPERTRVIAVPEPKTLTPAVPEPKAQAFAGAPGGAAESPAPSSGESAPSPAPAFRLRTEHVFSVSDETEAKLQRARELLAHRYPLGDLASIFEAALDALLDAVDLARRKARPESAPRAGAAVSAGAAVGADRTRSIPQWVKRAVRRRDEDRCAYASMDGRRCGERKFLQFDHVVPWSLGGRSDDPKNIRHLCGAHNRWAWRHAFVTRS